MSVNNSLAKKENRLGFSAYVTQDAVKKRINEVIGGKNGIRFISSIVSAVQSNPKLTECTNASILSAALQGEALNLPASPQLGYYYLVPYNKKVKHKDANGRDVEETIKEAQFQLSAKGYKQLAMRSGQYLDIDVIYIHEGEYLGRDKYTGKQKFEFIEDDDERESRPIIGYLAYFEMLNGFRKQMYWTKAKMENHADKYSQAFSIASAKKLAEGKIPKNELWKYSSYWYTSFDEMAEKTMIRQLLSKWGMLTTELATAFEADMSVINDDGTKTYVDNVETVPETVIEAEAIPVDSSTGEVIEQVAEPVKQNDAQAEDIQSALFN